MEKDTADIIEQLNQFNWRVVYQGSKLVLRGHRLPGHKDLFEIRDGTLYLLAEDFKWQLAIYDKELQAWAQLTFDRKMSLWSKVRVAEALRQDNEGTY